VEERIQALREALSEAKRVAALTGAGISAESGVPTFRGAGGLWRNYNPQELATPEAFARDPRLVWEWYDWRRGLIAKAQPNAGHAALVEIERRATNAPGGRGSFSLITQNVDGLHDRAGSRNVVKLHGDIWVVRCETCGRESRNEQVPLAEIPPRCPCGAMLRPGVVWFGEPLPPGEWARAEEASRSAQVFLVIGTSAVVYPAAGLAEIARAAGAQIAVINAATTPLDCMADWVVHGQAGEVLPRLL
jgi:NAD-dependent deacetylase